MQGFGLQKQNRVQGFAELEKEASRIFEKTIFEEA
jgi:hypothetical protein